MVEGKEGDGVVDTEKTIKCRGQALIEFTIGLVVLIVLAAVFAQLAVFVRAGHGTAVRAREQAGALALQEYPFSTTARYIGSTSSGPDARPYTRDDDVVLANPRSFYSGILEPLAADPTDWNTLDSIADNAFTQLRASENPISIFGLLRGEDSETVTLLPAVRHLLYRDQSIRIEETVWMPWTRGIY